MHAGRAMDDSLHTGEDISPIGAGTNPSHDAVIHLWHKSIRQVLHRSNDIKVTQNKVGAQGTCRQNQRHQLPKLSQREVTAGMEQNSFVLISTGYPGEIDQPAFKSDLSGKILMLFKASSLKEVRVMRATALGSDSMGVSSAGSIEPHYECTAQPSMMEPCCWRNWTRSGICHAGGLKGVLTHSLRILDVSMIPSLNL